MEFWQAMAKINSEGVISISTDEGRKYIWDCVNAAKSIGPCVEVGSAYGGTTALMCMTGASVISIDNWQCGQREVFESNMHKLGLGPEMMVGTTEDWAHDFNDKSLGYVMIDAFHHGECPYDDARLMAPKIAPGGFLLFDAVANGHPDVTKAMARWLADCGDVSHDFRWHGDVRRVEDCSSAHNQTVIMGFIRIK